MKTKRLNLAIRDIPQHVDILFAPGSSPSGAVNCGWIEFSANEKGRAAVGRIFPKANFQWRACPYGWEGWQSFVPHLPQLAAMVANTLPQHLVKLGPLTEKSDNQLSFLMCAAAASQGVRTGWFEFGKKNRVRFNIYEQGFKGDANVLNMPTVRPLDVSDPAQAFLLRMVEVANENIKTYDGTTEPIKQIIDSAQVVLAIWSDLKEPHGFGFLVVKGEDIVKVSQVHGIPVQASANAFACQNYEHALATKEVLAA